MRPWNPHANIVRVNRIGAGDPLEPRAPGGYLTAWLAYNSLFRQRISTMEAEQLNALANTLADLSTRTRELRRYL